MEAINRFKQLFLEVWKEGVFGLNASEIIIGIIIFLLFYVLRRLFARFVISKLNKLVNKTSTKIDNTVVEVIEGPLKFLPVVLGFFIATSYINLSKEVQDFIDLLNRTLISDEIVICIDETKKNKLVHTTSVFCIGVLKRSILLCTIKEARFWV